MRFIEQELFWTRKPEQFRIGNDKIEITTMPHTDLWQRTYYKFRNDNAPVLQTKTDIQQFSFTVKTRFNSKHRFGQCGVIVYLDSENWLKASAEYEDGQTQNLGSVVTNAGYSDWAIQAIPAAIKEIWYRLSRRENDFCIEYSFDGVPFNIMRICHLSKAGGEISFGIYACSPEESSFTAVFSNAETGECKWKLHDGQQPDGSV